MHEPILVLKRDTLFFESDVFQGFSGPESRFEDLFCTRGEFVSRADAEKDPTLKQPICYAVLMNSAEQKVFCYQRASKGTEGRLHGKWSLGIGGHVDQCDGGTADPLTVSLLREIQEEVCIEGDPSPRIIGYINDDSNDVGRVHFGILYAIEVQSARAGEDELENGSMISFEEIDRMMSSPDITFEPWSRIAWEHLKIV